MFPILAHLRNSGARTIMCWKSSSDRRPSLSRSASSITFSHTILTSSSVSSLRVSLFSVFSRSDLQMKSSLLKSCRTWMKTHQERGEGKTLQLLAGCLRHMYQRREKPSITSGCSHSFYSSPAWLRSPPYGSEWHTRGVPDPWPWSCVRNFFICHCLLISGDPGAEHKPGFDKLFASITDYLNINSILCRTRHAYGRRPTDRIKQYGDTRPLVCWSWPWDRMLTFSIALLFYLRMCWFFSIATYFNRKLGFPLHLPLTHAIISDLKLCSFCGYFTINFKSVVGFEVTWRHLTQDGEHVQEIVQRHVPLSVLREDLGDPLAKWIVLHSGTEPVFWSCCFRCNCNLIPLHLSSSSRYFADDGLHFLIIMI